LRRPFAVDPGQSGALQASPRTFADRVVAEDSRSDLRPPTVDDVTVDYDTPAPAPQY
jgi:hypothetical protein